MTGGIARFAGKKPAVGTGTTETPHDAERTEELPPADDFGFGVFSGYGNDSFFGEGYADDGNFGITLPENLFGDTGGYSPGSDVGLGDDDLTKNAFDSHNVSLSVETSFFSFIRASFEYGNLHFC